MDVPPPDDTWAELGTLVFEFPSISVEEDLDGRRYIKTDLEDVRRTVNQVVEHHTAVLESAFGRFDPDHEEGGIALLQNLTEFLVRDAEHLELESGAYVEIGYPVQIVVAGGVGGMNGFVIRGVYEHFVVYPASVTIDGQLESTREPVAHVVLRDYKILTEAGVEVDIPHLRDSPTIAVSVHGKTKLSEIEYL